ncbi:MAG: YqgE/AlgH family protein [Ornithinimicrobium sp.]
MTGLSGYAGRLLVATPSLSDFFDRAVVLILQHDEDGTQGLVLNKPLDARVDAVLPQWHPHVTEPARLFQGGPVGMDSALGLVQLPTTDPQTAVVGVNLLGGGVGLVDLDAPAEVVVPQVRSLRVYVGYAGWTPGQLSEEIDGGAWHVVDADPQDAFRPDAEPLWREVLMRQRNKTSWLATYTDNPEHN